MKTKMKFMLIDFAVIAAVGLLSGCAMAPLKGGKATTLNKPARASSKPSSKATTRLKCRGRIKRR